MEPRNKIAKELSSKEYFLQNSMAEHELPNIYSLEAEFAKVQKNHDSKPYLVFFGFIVLLILSTILTTHYLEVKSKQVNIDISDFEDLRLKETLSAAKEKEQELHRKTEELNTKAIELSSKDRELASKKGEIKNLQSSFTTEVQRIKEQLQQEADLKNADKKALQRLEKKEQKRMEDLKKDYDTQISQRQTEILRLQEQVKNYPKKNLELEGYKYGLSTFLAERKAAGCIIDPRQKKNIIIFIAKDPKRTTETIVDLYRGNDEYIGKIKLVLGENGFRGETAELAKNQNLKSMDWFKWPE
jgi:DNA repair exonuclease SbcCD ATPase subunit